jgi:hypothetical protein
MAHIAVEQVHSLEHGQHRRARRVVADLRDGRWAVVGSIGAEIPLRGWVAWVEDVCACVRA